MAEVLANEVLVLALSKLKEKSISLSPDQYAPNNEIDIKILETNLNPNELFIDNPQYKVIKKNFSIYNKYGELLIEVKEDGTTIGYSPKFKMPSDDPVDEEKAERCFRELIDSYTVITIPKVE